MLPRRFPAAPLQLALTRKKLASGLPWPEFLDQFVRSESEDGSPRVTPTDFRRLAVNRTIDAYTADRICVVVFGVSPHVFYPDFGREDSPSAA